MEPNLQNVVKPYNKDADKKKSQISRMFNKIAPYYDFLNRFLSLGIDTLWRKRAIRQLNETEHKFVLDVATGTADLANICRSRALYRSYPPSLAVLWLACGI